VNKQNYGVKAVVSGLKQAFSSYLQAQYHIRDEALVSERAAIFETVGSIAQEPFLEATPSYQSIETIDSLRVPKPSAALLSELAAMSPSVGIPSQPYYHQVEALEAFLDKEQDILTATGTGSGKTEVFLMSILGMLALEAAERPGSALLPGCRALLLYPMNALVVDQLARIRRLFGNPRVADLLQAKMGRRIRFGMYSSRTPFPGEKTGLKCAKFIKPLFEEFYLKYENHSRIQQELAEKGKWPCKDLVRFYAADEPRWENRLLTQPMDTELFTRHEMHAQCPDLLITNYSMLEYMMLRPIERSIFDQTRAWLSSNEENELVLVLDEAHMYRGTGGAEVAMLIRRLISRLQVPRERVRFILTTASVGDSEEVALRFAQELTGLRTNSKRTITLIRGKTEELKEARPANRIETQILSAFDLGKFQELHINPTEAIQTVKDLAQKLEWNPENLNPENLDSWLHKTLSDFGPVKSLIDCISGKADTFTRVAQVIFPEGNDEEASRALEALLALANQAKLKNGRVLLPARLHLFFRGVQGIYVCLNPQCSKKRTTVIGILGSVHTEPNVKCECGSRVYELLTHRDCGTAYLRGFVKRSRDFLWHERGTLVGASDGDELEPLQEIHFLVAETVHPRARDIVPMWLDRESGQIFPQEPKELNGFTRVWAAIQRNIPSAREPISFPRCPVCLKGWHSDNSKIMDLRTKGEHPFSELVKAQTFLQPPTKPASQFPNEGRKVLLFSDGRQKAARLARNIPRDVEHDSFRECLVMAARKLEGIPREPTIGDQKLYLAFVAVVDQYQRFFFDGEAQKKLQNDAKRFRTEYEANLDDALEHWTSPGHNERFQEALLRQLCNPYYSLRFVTAGWLEPAKNPLRRFNAGLQAENLQWTDSDAKALVATWINELARDYAIDPNLTTRLRERIAGWPRNEWGHTGRLSEPMSIILKSSNLNDEKIEVVRLLLLETFCENTTDRWFLKRDNIKIRIDLDAPWFECSVCTAINPTAPFGFCSDCGAPNLRALNLEESRYIRSRKGVWRNPIRQCLNGEKKPYYISAEEHTAQLSYRDVGVVRATTEKHELLFQDIIIDPRTESPVDVLSCTTTMEVGIDIGSLVAVGLGNVPPQRENYQQRAGRAGRRGSAVSSVVTYCQGGPHDSHYFANVAKMVAGPSREPKIKTNNPKIARRHVHAYLIQTYFLSFSGSSSGSLTSALGRTRDFFDDDKGQPCYDNFRTWIDAEILNSREALFAEILSWLPKEIDENLDDWLKQTARAFLQELKLERDRIRLSNVEPDESTSDADSDQSDADDPIYFLNFLFNLGVFPTYAFPTDLSSFTVERFSNNRVRAEQKPQQSIVRALSEYAPGRLVVINKRTYKSAAVTANTSAYTVDRARALFAPGSLKEFVFCTNSLCSYVREQATHESLGPCPLCNSSLAIETIVKPEVFLPFLGEDEEERDSDQEITYASPAQFPLPTREDEENWSSIGKHASKAFAEDRTLIVVNRGNAETMEGFDVCERCGSARLHDGRPTGSHTRPYFTMTPRGETRANPTCDGESRNVFLGSSFLSDIMILRIISRPPFAIQPIPRRSAFMALQNGLRTLAEALSLAASRRLDLDPAEFSCGFRIFPSISQTDQLIGEVYLFDTLSGGAGYSNQIGDDLENILRRDVSPLLTKCSCERSCYHCLRHYGNQFYHAALDRNLGSSLLQYALDGVMPGLTDWDQQASALKPLKRMLTLAGFSCEEMSSINGQPVPLLVRSSDSQLALAVTHGFYESQSLMEHPLHVHLRGNANFRSELINEYSLSRNLPAVFQKLTNMLAA